ncbi:tRNA pseudouridine(55) synthase TruB [Acidihalobacter yilgarnensis]|uniref:tRNA pseudouridine synthase B n=1 Tax=Acidihalobacter yilgarnensis TaxID=2819280 RepID=A0A1D8IM53_9GAMM|nr:tRNA pseudouridine(55) synthase TruB [Acidihalobacter yilgarnensis]AOU97547.1 tRNA pseudouridine(55) synthase TruB [Acidihalobacter yilgarnensis]
MVQRNRPVERRDVSGVLLLDKPQGLSSNQALQAVKRIFRARKAGHTGSLDPLATGLLPICLGEATKVSSYLLEADKHYRASAQLGVRTDSADSQGHIIARHDVPLIGETDLEAAMVPLRGEIDQVPPMYSALKHEGRRLYELARAGVEVERKARRMRVDRFELLLRDGDRLDFDIRCSSGTYVRTLIDDLGEALGCGAHVIALRRLGVSPFDDPRMYTLEQLRELAEAGSEALDAALLPVDTALARWPQVRLGPDAAYYLGQGQAVWLPRAPVSGLVGLYNDVDDVFLGIGEILDDGRVSPKRLMRWALTGG